MRGTGLERGDFSRVLRGAELPPFGFPEHAESPGMVLRNVQGADDHLSLLPRGAGIPSHSTTCRLGCVHAGRAALLVLHSYFQMEHKILASSHL